MSHTHTHSHTSYTRNLRNWFLLASPEEIEQGTQWYDNARAEAHTLATAHNTDTPTVAAMIAALSPRITWDETLKAAKELLRHKSRAKGIAGFRMNHTKALRILAGESPNDVLGGKKVTNFFRNILGDGDAITVDTWAARAAGETRPLDRHNRYERIANAYRSVAREIGLEPRQFQAVIWLVIRNRDGLDNSQSDA
jgi:hypothetical protein